jgi:hypothetical protein
VPTPTGAVRYRFGAVTVCSGVPLPGYARYRTPAGAGRRLVTVRRAGRVPPAATPLCRHRTARGLLEIGVTAGGHRVVSAQGLAACTVGPGAAVAWHVGEAPSADDADFLLSMIIPWALGTEPDTSVLHAATVVGPAGAVLLCGPSGAGKSTLSMALHRAVGWRLFGDDSAVLCIDDDRPVVYSCSREVRLWADAAELLGLGPGVPLPRYRTKSRHPVDGAADDPVPVAAIVQLVNPSTPGPPPAWAPAISRTLNDHPDEPTVLTRLSGTEGIVALRNGLMRIAPLTAAQAAREFAFMVRWGAGVPAAALRYPRSIDALPAAIRRIVGLIDDRTGRPV